MPNMLREDIFLSVIAFIAADYTPTKIKSQTKFYTFFIYR